MNERSVNFFCCALAFDKGRVYGTWDSMANKIINLITFPFHQADRQTDTHTHRLDALHCRKEFRPYLPIDNDFARVKIHSII